MVGTILVVGINYGLVVEISSAASTSSGEQEIYRKNVSHSPFETEVTGNNRSRSTVESAMVELRWCTDQLIVTLVQKVCKSFFGEIEFLAPSCSFGSALTPLHHNKNPPTLE